MLAGAILVVLLAVGVAYLLTRPDDLAVPPAGPSEQATEFVEPTPFQPPEPSPTIQPTQSTQPPVTPSPTPTRKRSVLDPPVRADEQPDPTDVVSGSTEGCTSSSKTVYGGYPAAICYMWHATEGRLTGEPAKKTKNKVVACQRDLREKNPTYAKRQANTWWVWTTSTDGTWDWFPETAIAQGESNEPINGIALCHS